MDNYTNIDLRKLLASAALEDEKLAEELRNEGADKFAFQKIEWKADEGVGGFERISQNLCVDEPFITGTVQLK